MLIIHKDKCDCIECATKKMGSHQWVHIKVTKR